MQSALRGRKTAADKIDVRGVEEAQLWDAARAMDGFSGATHIKSGRT